jgi:catechol 2,3-dioxygenase-like lactoylglutathione lyase family enzyme
MTGDQVTKGTPVLSIRSVVVSVKDLDHSSAFYQEVMNLPEVLREDQIAVLGGHESGMFTLYLREAQRNATHSGPQALGIRALSCDVASFAELDRIEDRLRALSAFTSRQVLDPENGFELVRGHDPDRLPLIFVAAAAGGVAILDDYHRALSQLFAIDV